jgi:hypothetical protein
MQIPTANALVNVIWPLPMLSRYERMPKNTGGVASYSPLSKPILSANGTVATIISEERAPEISPKVSTVLFMGVSVQL